MTKYLSFQYSDLSGDFFIFQQDNAPAYRAHETVHLLTCETPDFIAPALWPANSPDLNLVNYQIGGSCRSVYRSRIYDVDQLKSCLTEEWLRTSELLKFAFFEYICIYFHGHLQKRLILTSLNVRDIT